MSSAIEGLNAALQGRYRLDTEIARGGAGVVYSGADLRHHRKIAVKVLHADVEQTVGDERFLREIQITAGLNHPHILPLYDSGEADGRFFYVMPLVEGETLREHLASGPLSLDEAIRITTEVADALEYAHGHGVVHRDIKPENIMLAAGHALVADFGIARASAADTGNDVRLTGTGLAVGTARYMSPEQQSGDDVGPASDIFSLACVLHEMLVGKPPFGSDVHPGIPRSVTRTLRKALAAEPDRRFTSARAFAVSLTEGAPRVPALRRRRVAALVAALVVVTAAAAFLTWPRLRPAATAGRDAPGYLEPASVAVLQFKVTDTMTWPGLSAYASNLADRLTDGLGQIEILTVSARRAVAIHEQAAVPLDSLARALKAGTLIAGTLTAIGPSRIRIDLELIEGPTNRQIGQTHIEANLPERLQLVDAVADSVISLLRPVLGTTIQKRNQLMGTTSDKAYDLAQSADELTRSFEGFFSANNLGAARRSLDEADSLYDAAERSDPRWIEPKVRRARLAQPRMMLASFEHVDGQRWLRQGLGHVDRALRIAPNDPLALEVRGSLNYWRWRDHRPKDTTTANALRDSTEADLRRAVSGHPERARVLRVLSELLAASGRPQEAIRMAVRGFDSDPYLNNTPTLALRLFQYNLEIGNDTAAARWCRDGAGRAPDRAEFDECQLQLMAWTSLMSPDPAKARGLKARALAHTAPPATAILEPRLDQLVGVVYARAGARDSARAVLRRGLAGPQANVGIVIPAANIYDALGQRDSAVTLVVRFAGLHPELLDMMRRDPGLRKLGRDPQVASALRAPSGTY